MRHLFLALLFAQSLLAQNTDPFPSPPNVKGLQVQMIDDALKLGIHHAGVNINITAPESEDDEPPPSMGQPPAAPK